MMRGLAIFLLLPLCGCTLIGLQPPALNDLRVEGVTITPARTHPMDLSRPAPGLFAHVRVSTRMEMTQYARRYGSTVWLTEVACDADGAPRWGATAIRDEEGRNVEGYANVSIPAQRPDDDGRWRYTLQLPIPAASRDGALGPGERGATRERESGGAKPLDLCFRFDGGNMLGFAHRSRTHRVPHALIAVALARAGQP